MRLKKELGELKKISEAYCKNKTFVFVEELVNNKKTYYNGYIISVKDDMILFYDSCLKKEFPILLECLNLIKPSRKQENGY